MSGFYTVIGTYSEKFVLTRKRHISFTVWRSFFQVPASNSVLLKQYQPVFCDCPTEPSAVNPSSGLAVQVIGRPLGVALSVPQQQARRWPTGRERRRRCARNVYPRGGSGRSKVDSGLDTPCPRVVRQYARTDDRVRKRALSEVLVSLFLPGDTPAGGRAPVRARQRCLNSPVQTDRHLLRRRL